ncbi:hypothetical protein OKW21_004616 [Catalinimonas alkaloidigena]|uniref:hypothetical protein n=1 Tax=Catalinimonas alkaloidigena TaxID=1075417 RepID=UPI002405C963|nr:hypothetical protein [Catalinimonas alkaloidigena]MDF9799353.1 hypothetical protein [Catalinimonas alkaloidigena]
MATLAQSSDVFKFVALRPPVPADKASEKLNFIADQRNAEDTPVGKLVKSFTSEEATQIPERVVRFIDSNKYEIAYPDIASEPTLFIIHTIASHVNKDDFSIDRLTEEIENTLASTALEFLKIKETQNLLDGIWDRYYAFYLLNKTESISLEGLTQHLRTFHLLQSIAYKSPLNSYENWQAVLSAQPLIAKLFTDLPKPLLSIEPTEHDPSGAENIPAYQKLWAQWIDAYRAVEEVKNLRFDTQLSTVTKNVIMPNKETGVEAKGKVTSVKNDLMVNKKSFASLHASTLSVFKQLNLSENNLHQSDAYTQLQTHLNNTISSITNINDPLFLTQMPLEAKSLPGLSAVVSKFEKYIDIPFLPYYPPTNIRKLIRPLGIGDLKVVKQKLKKYVAGEVAHIENVLRGEYKERKHRVLDRTEDIFTVTNETDEETTKDTQTTERFELKKESEKTLEEKMSIQAGVTVSGSYGMVTFGAHGDFAYSTSSKESSKNASNFAREVIDKSVSKIQKKTKEERSTKKLHEVEEINTHGIDNKDKAGHAVGIYRWVDKYYEAQVYNYGKRLMFEFIIPEPSAFYEFAQQNKPKKNIIPPITPYRWILDTKGKWMADGIITHKDINELNYQLYIRDYNAQGITPPPLPYKTISASIAKEGMPIDGNPHVVNIKELLVPEGYISKVGVWFDCSAYFVNYPKLEVIIGNKIFRPLEIGGGGVGVMANNHDNAAVPFHWFWPANPIQISVNLYDIGSFAMNAYALVERTPELYELWQIQTYEKIMTAYKAMQVEYAQKSAAQEVQAGILIQGQNPRINRSIEKLELKKQCIKSLMDTYLYGTFDAMKTTGIASPPDYDIFDAFEEGKTIQFFEQAFEWENLTYLFYPYFWARRSEWIRKLNTYDTDPLFTQFLQAGSARVVLPVHPAYNDAIMYFLESNGAIWKGGEPPRLNDQMFISIADELRNQTDDLANAKPEGDPWEVILPTTLVYLQENAELPTFN